jgi:hypothetical protein
MKVAALLVAGVLAIGVVWLAGEQHRENCLSSGKTGCSVLPWVAGNAASEEVVRPTGKLTPRGCIQLALRNAGATTTDQIQPRPPECR